MREGYDHIELVKRYSTLGMGPSQGRHSAAQRRAPDGEASGLAPDAVGPHHRATAGICGRRSGILAGRAFEPVRLTRDASPPPGGRRADDAGGRLATPRLLRAAGRTARRLIREEALNVRNNVGIIDVSTLGGIEVCGPDAAEFLERLYTFAYQKQEVGRSRYLLMTDETGVIIDDGVACRLHRAPLLRHRHDERRR